MTSECWFLCSGPASMFKRHEECRQHFISSLTALRQHLGVGRHSSAMYELLRANAAVAQGLVWAELCGITDAGWIARMNDIDRIADALGVRP